MHVWRTSKIYIESEKKSMVLTL